MSNTKSSTPRTPRVNIDEMMTARQAAEKLHIHRTSITRLIQRGQIEGFRVGKRLLIAHSELERFLAANRT